MYAHQIPDCTRSQPVLIRSQADIADKYAHMHASAVDIDPLGLSQARPNYSLSTGKDNKSVAIIVTSAIGTSDNATLEE